MSTQHFTEILEKTTNILGHDTFKNLELKNGLRMSIKASSFNYCTPRTSGLEASEYSAFEVAVLKDNSIIDPRSKVAEPSKEDQNIFPYLDTDIVQELYEELSALTEEQVKNL